MCICKMSDTPNVNPIGINLGLKRISNQARCHFPSYPVRTWWFEIKTRRGGNASVSIVPSFFRRIISSIPISVEVPSDFFQDVQLSSIVIIKSQGAKYWIMNTKCCDQSSMRWAKYILVHLVDSGQMTKARNWAKTTHSVWSPITGPRNKAVRTTRVFHREGGITNRKHQIQTNWKDRNSLLLRLVAFGFCQVLVQLADWAQSVQHFDWLQNFPLRLETKKIGTKFFFFLQLWSDWSFGKMVCRREKNMSLKGGCISNLDMNSQTTKDIR